MKKTITAVLGLLLLLMAAPTAVQAQYAYSTNADGSIYTYSTNADSSITIAGYSGPPWATIIPTNINGLLVTSIGLEAFFICTNLSSVTIPDSVTSIGNYAFDYCTNLTSITIPDSVTSIGDLAFGVCTSLTSVAIPSNVTNMGETPFAGSTNLTAITVDTNNSFYSSLNGVLFDKSQITLIEYPDGLGGSYTIPGSVTSIGDGAFGSCASLASIAIPGNVTSIGEGAFSASTSLTNANIENGVTNIGAFAFDSCKNLVSITISGSATNIGLGAFFICTNLNSVYFQGNAPILGYDVTLFYDVNATVYYLPGTIGWSAFAADTGLPAVLWNPVIQTGGDCFGVLSNHFGFNITGTNNFTVVVEACTNLANPVWTPLQTVTLTNGSFYFNDPQWANYSGRYYGLGMP